MDGGGILTLVAAVSLYGAQCSPPERADESLIVIAQSCCKMCSKGKACGDSCISRDKTCRVGGGCACNR